MVADEAELVEEGLAGLASVLADGLGVERGEGEGVREGVEGEGEGEAQVLLQLLAAWPVARSALDVCIIKHDK